MLMNVQLGMAAARQPGALGHGAAGAGLCAPALARLEHRGGLPLGWIALVLPLVAWESGAGRLRPQLVGLAGMAALGTVGLHGPRAWTLLALQRRSHLGLSHVDARLGHLCACWSCWPPGGWRRCGPLPAAKDRRKG